LLKSCS